ncbi:hypothetical protein WJX81_000382 [Elliptochloris bilobata]|uniref:O-fucosyltransferase family protein n=1 Tax=Elliptochloris bilobata TaxID=381761 RepID=A0AAW1RCF4_9CHLO
MPIFEGFNGTFFVDQEQFKFKCKQDGGLQDFLDLGEHITAWMPEAEAQAPGTPCSRFDLLQADSLAADIDVGWGELAALSARRIWKLQPWLAAEAGELVRELEALPEPRIGMHIRSPGTTAVQKHLAIEPQVYLDHFIAAFPDVKNGTCIMFGGDAAWVDLAGRLAAEQIGCAPHPLAPALARLAPPPGSDPNPKEGSACLATRSLILQLEAMGRADYFVGTTTSAIPGIVQTLRTALYGKEHRTFVAHGGDWYDRIRTYFQGDIVPARRLFELPPLK